MGSNVVVMSLVYLPQGTIYTAIGLEIPYTLENIVTSYSPQGVAVGRAGYLVATASETVATGHDSYQDMQTIGDTSSGDLTTVSSQLAYRFVTVPATPAGFVDNGNLKTTLADNPSISVNYVLSSSTGVRFYNGFSSATTLPNSNTPLANTDHGIIVGFRSADSTFVVIHNDGTGAAAVDSFTTTKNASARTINITATAGQVDVAVDSEHIILTSRIPAPATDLYIFYEAQAV